MERLESLFELSTNAAVRSNKTEEEVDVDNKTKRRKRAASEKTISKGKAFKEKTLTHVNTFMNHGATHIFLL